MLKNSSLILSQICFLGFEVFFFSFFLISHKVESF